MSSEGVTLSSLATLVNGQLIGETSVIDVTHDSRSVEPGSLFVAIRGFSTDGHRYVEQAINAGASAICVENQVVGCPVPQLIVENSRRALGLLACGGGSWTAVIEAAHGGYHRNQREDDRCLSPRVNRRGGRAGGRSDWNHRSIDCRSPRSTSAYDPRSV